MKLKLNQPETASNFILLSKNPSGKTRGIFCLRHFLTLLFISFLLYSNHLSSQPKLEVKNSKINFGVVKKGEVIRNAFEITNTGNSPLLLDDVEISCSCTTADFSKEPILPGQKTIVTVNFNTKTVYGRQDRVVLLLSNTPKGPVKLRYKGIVIE